MPQFKIFVFHIELRDKAVLINLVLKELERDITFIKEFCPQLSLHVKEPLSYLTY